MSENAWLFPPQDIHTVLEAGLAEIRARFQDGSIDTYLKTAFKRLPDQKFQDLRGWLAQTRIEVQRGFSREEVRTPSLTIALHSESQGEFIGDTGGRFVGENQVAAIRGEAWTSNYAVIAEAENGDATSWLHQLVKFMLAHSRTQFTFMGYREVHLAAQDLTLDQRFMQAGRFLYGQATGITLVYHQLSDLVELTEVTKDEQVSEYVNEFAASYSPPA